MTERIAPVSDPCWADPDYRTARLRGLIALYSLRAKDIMELTGSGRDIVRHWMSGKYQQIPTPILRSLMYDLLARGQHDQA